MLPFEKQYFDNDVIMQSKYFSNLMNDMPYEVSDDKVVWKDEKDVVEKYQNQILEIEMLYSNIEKLKKIRKNPLNNKDQIWVLNKYISTLEKARRIYSQGRDDEEFRKTIVRMNRFMDTHIVKRRGRERLVLVVPKDREVGYFSYGIICGHRIAIINMTEDEFDEILSRE